jgi:hypothetical protein
MGRVGKMGRMGQGSGVGEGKRADLGGGVGSLEERGKILRRLENRIDGGREIG